MNGLPLVTVVTPSYNQAAFLEATIRSVLDQDYPRLEYFVNDGGSTDGSTEIIRRYAGHLAGWVSERDAGQSDAVNKGWRAAKGDILAWINSDDTYLPDAIRQAAEFMQAHPDVGLVYGDCALIDAQDRRIGTLHSEPFALDTLLYANYIPQPTVFIRRVVLERIGLLNPALDYAMDYDYWMRAALCFPLKEMQRELATYRWHGEGKFISRPDQMLLEYVAILKAAFANPAFPRGLLPQRARAIGTCYLRWGLYCFTADKLQRGSESVMQAFQEDPSLRNEKELVRETLAYHIVNVLSSRTRMDEHSNIGTDGWLDTVYSHWPPDARATLPSRSELMAQAELIRGFGAYQEHDLNGAGQAMWQAVRKQPRYLANRGVLSILWRAATQQAR